MKIQNEFDFSPLADSLGFHGSDSSFQKQLEQKLTKLKKSVETGESESTEVQDTEMDKENKKLQSAAREFEAFFLSQMFKQMRKTVPETDLFGDPNHREMFTSLLDDERGKMIAYGQGMGLAAQLYEQIRPPSQIIKASIADNQSNSSSDKAGG